MCAILDANMFGQFMDQGNEDMQPVWNWLERKNGKIAYSNTKKFDEEWEQGGVTDLIKLLKQAEKLKEIPAPDVQQKEDAPESCDRPETHQYFQGPAYAEAPGAPHLAIAETIRDQLLDTQHSASCRHKESRDKCEQHHCVRDVSY